MVLIDVVVYSEYGKVFRAQIWPGSVERSIDLDNEGTLPLPIKIEKVYSAKPMNAINNDIIYINNKKKEQQNKKN
jgi:hypothetical protein